jgi:multidrug efflux pump subunit AcrA (membrane-fusion protein)
MLIHPVGTDVASGDGARSARGPHAVRKLPWWRRLRWQIGLLGLLLVVVIVVLTAQRSSAPAATVPPTVPAALTAHGKILPARQARVGTQNGGIVRQLTASPGMEVTDRAELARVEGVAGVEVVTAPFAGLVANVLVHEGDTLMPGAALFVVADMRTLQVETTDVDEFLVSQVRAGQQVRVTVDTLDNVALQGTVKSVAGLPQADSTGGQSYPVVITLGGVPSSVRAGMSVRVTFPE